MLAPAMNAMAANAAVANATRSFMSVRERRTLCGRSTTLAGRVTYADSPIERTTAFLIANVVLRR